MTKTLAAAIGSDPQPLLNEYNSYLPDQNQVEEITSTSPKRVIKDEGFFRSLKIAWNVFTQPEIRERVLEMKNSFDRYQDQLGYIALCAKKEEQ